MPPHRPALRRAVVPAEREDVRRAIADLYGAERAKPLGPRDLSAPGGGPWSLLDEFVLGGTHFSIVCARESSAAASLTVRERQVASLASAGESNKAIGYRLDISASTVGVLLWRVSSKLGTRSRAELASALAVSVGAPANMANGED